MTDVAPETDFDAERAKAQVAAVSKLALPYLLDACDEIERLHSLLLRAEGIERAARCLIDSMGIEMDDMRLDYVCAQVDCAALMNARAALTPKETKETGHG